MKRGKNTTLVLSLTLILLTAVVTALPQGCKEVKTGSGLKEVDCDFDKKKFEEFNVEKMREECEGKFEVKNGEPTCTVEGKSGLTDKECPSEEKLKKVKESCKGEVREVTDDSGCQVVKCVNKEFKGKFDKAVEEEYEGVKSETVKCGKNGGHLIKIDNQTKCVGDASVEKSGKGEEGKKGPDEIEKLTAEDFEKIIQKFEKLEEKLDKITKKFKKKRDKSEVFKIGYYNLQSVKVKIRNFKSQVSGEGEGFDKGMQKKMLDEFEGIKDTISETTEAVVNGEVPEKSKMLEKEFERQKKYYAGAFESKEKFEEKVEKEKDILKMVRNCHRYEKPDSFKPPLPKKAEEEIEKVEIQYENDSCMMTIHVGNKSTIFALDTKTYTKFTGLRSVPDKLCQKNCGALEGVDERTQGEKCMEECVTRDCDKGILQCLKINREECEKECGMTGKEKERGAEAECIQECMKEKGMGGIECEPGEGEKGEQNPYCLECADKCVGLYYENTPCIPPEEVKKKEEGCRQSGEYMYAKQVKGESGKDGECVVEVKCKSAEEEFGTNASGAEGVTGSVTGSAISRGRGLFLGIIDWFKELFNLGEKKTDRKGQGEPKESEEGQAEKKEGNINKTEAIETIKDLEELNRDVAEIERSLS